MKDGVNICDVIDEPMILFDSQVSGIIHLNINYFVDCAWARAD
jgi:hypothetical protein